MQFARVLRALLPGIGEHVSGTPPWWYFATSHAMSCATASILAIQHDSATLIALALGMSPLASLAGRFKRDR